MIYIRIQWIFLSIDVQNQLNALSPMIFFPSYYITTTQQLVLNNSSKINNFPTLYNEFSMDTYRWKRKRVVEMVVNIN